VDSNLRWQTYAEEIVADEQNTQKTLAVLIKEYNFNDNRDNLSDFI